MATFNQRMFDRFESKFIPEPMSGCWLWTAYTNSAGYGQIQMSNGIPGGRKDFAHRVAWLLYRGAIPPGLFVLHRCDVRCCVNPDHLFLGTIKDNYDDMVAKGRITGFGPLTQRGESHSCAKLTAADVVAIRASAQSTAALALEYGVQRRAIQKILNRTRWRDT